MAINERPAWAARLRYERRDRGWSQSQMARRLTQAAAALGITLPERESVLRRIKDWEAGRHKPKDPYPALYARALGMDEGDLFTDSPPGRAPLPSPTATPVAAPDAVALANSAAQEMTEFGMWAETTNVGAGTLAYFDDRACRLARGYLRGRPGPCLRQAADLARRTFHLLQGGHQHHHQTFDLYVIAGKLCALMSWISSDLGQIAAADAHARTGLILADQVGHPALTALLLSAQSKIAFWEARYDQAAQLARHGHDIAPCTSAKVLLACQEADAWQAQGALAHAQAALDRAAHAREHITAPDQLGGPFECGPARQANYTMGVYLRARQTGDALKAAAEADQAWNDGDVWAYGTWAQVRIGSAIAHVMAGEMDGAEQALRPVMELPAEHRLAPLSARLTRELTPLLESKPLCRVRQALVLREQITEYCAGSAGMTRQLAGG